jgi:GT2 family glycosyltransferase
LNPDIELTDNSLKKIINHLDKDAEVGIAGPRLFYPNGTSQHSVRRFPKPWDQLMILLKVPHVLTNLGAVNYYLHTDFDFEKTQDVNQVMGAYFVIKRELINDVGLLDEGFFYWFEEVDYCLRAKKAGWKVKYYADVSAVHHQAGSFSREKTIRKQAVIRRSLRRYIRKHFGWKPYLVFVSLDPLFRLLAVIAHIIKGK